MTQPQEEHPVMTEPEEEHTGPSTSSNLSIATKKQKLSDMADVQTMADCIARKKAELFLITEVHPELVSVFKPHERDSRLTQQWVSSMIRGHASPLYTAYQPIAIGGRMLAENRRVTREECLLRSQDKLQSFPLYVAMHLSETQRCLKSLWEVFLCDERLKTHPHSVKQFNMIPDDVLVILH